MVTVRWLSHFWGFGFVVALSNFIAVPTARSSEYEVTGTLVCSYVGHRFPDIPAYTNISHFTVAVRGTNWVIRIQEDPGPNLQPGQTAMPAAEISPLHGGNVVTWFQDHKDRLAGQSVIIDRSAPCFPAEPNAAYIWFAYASATWLDARNGSNTLERINILGGPTYTPNVKTQEWPADFHRSDQAPRLPKDAAWKPFDNKTVLAYEVKRWNETEDGLSLPTDFHFTIYELDNGKVTHQLSVKDVSVSSKCTLSLGDQPRLPTEGLLKVVDWRFANDPRPIERMNYTVSNAWYSKEELRHRPGFDRVQLSAARQREFQANRPMPVMARAVLGLLVFIFFLFPLIAMLLGHRKTAASKK